ncbi:hypothetical protein AKJ47_01080 [candidate division MSBL1 archaeon SCGC-AAA261G05]|uniref:Uncharacterized protein n=2 Tax=candidate division MSBL1 TaxID=215777 RepID=A0A133V285_9EURY|nr:hypothetical protein AKJ42_00370 [candidate division MSBL1 archaeon SCGC-AAA261C02]KXB04025.1 hypothetical protein AKJ47_01080 [candidate division MSBL1 archaeon SCGC-AAA261G05]
MKNRRIGLKAVIVILIIGELVIGGLALHSYFSHEKSLTPSEIKEHAEKYQDERVTVEGYYITQEAGWHLPPVSYYEGIYDELPDIQETPLGVSGIPLENTYDFNLTDTEKYRITGIFHDGALYVSKVEHRNSNFLFYTKLGAIILVLILLSVFFHIRYGKKEVIETEQW